MQQPHTPTSPSLTRRLCPVDILWWSSGIFEGESLFLTESYAEVEIEVTLVALSFYAFSSHVVHPKSITDFLFLQGESDHPRMSTEVDEKSPS